MDSQEALLFESIAAVRRLLEAFALYGFIGMLIACVLVTVCVILDPSPPRAPPENDKPPEPP